MSQRNNTVEWLPRKINATERTDVAALFREAEQPEDDFPGKTRFRGLFSSAPPSWNEAAKFMRSCCKISSLKFLHCNSRQDFVAIAKL